MSKIQKLILVAAFLNLFLFNAASASEPSAAGLWQIVQDSKPVAWVLVVDRKDGTFEGVIAKKFSGAGRSEVCDKCSGDRKNAPLLGITVIRDMKRAGLKYQDGDFLDPRDGKLYKAGMTVSPDGKALTLRGHSGIGLFGKDKVWRRLPDTALADLDPAIRARYFPVQAAALPAPARAEGPAQTAAAEVERPPSLVAPASAEPQPKRVKTVRIVAGTVKLATAPGAAALEPAASTFVTNAPASAAASRPVSAAAAAKAAASQPGALAATGGGAGGTGGGSGAGVGSSGEGGAGSGSGGGNASGASKSGGSVAGVGAAGGSGGGSGGGGGGSGGASKGGAGSGGPVSKGGAGGGGGGGSASKGGGDATVDARAAAAPTEQTTSGGSAAPVSGNSRPATVRADDDSECQQRMRRLGVINTGSCVDLGAIIKELEVGTYKFNKPERAFLGESFKFVMVLATAPDQDVDEAFKGVSGALAEQRGRFAQSVEATLRGADLKIEPSGPQARTATTSEPVVWDWTLVPEQGGKKKLTVEVFANLQVGADRHRVQVRTLHQEIEIQVTTYQRLKSYVVQANAVAVGITTAISTLIAFFALIPRGRDLVRKAWRSLRGKSPPNRSARRADQSRRRA